MRRDRRKVVASLLVYPSILPEDRNGAPRAYHGLNRLKILPKHTAVRQEWLLQVRGAVGEERGKTTRSHERDHMTRTAAGLQTQPTLAANPQPRPIGVPQPASHDQPVLLLPSWVHVSSSHAPGRRATDTDSSADESHNRQTQTSLHSTRLRRDRREPRPEDETTCVLTDKGNRLFRFVPK